MTWAKESWKIMIALHLPFDDTKILFQYRTLSLEDLKLTSGLFYLQKLNAMLVIQIQYV